MAMEAGEGNGEKKKVFPLAPGLTTWQMVRRGKENKKYTPNLATGWWLVVIGEGNGEERKRGKENNEKNSYSPGLATGWWK